MNRTAYFFRLLLICLAGSLIAACEQKAAATTRPQGPLLWHITDANSTVYLFGSIHALRPGDYPLGPHIEAAYKAADVLVLEIDMSQVDQTTLRDLTLQKGLLPEGGSIQDLLSPAAYAQTEQHIANLGYDVATLNRFEPWLLSLTLLALETQKAGFDPAQGVDQTFSARAVADGKTIIGLETAEYQLSLFDQMSAAVQEKFLLETLAEAANYNAQLDTLVAAWKRGDAKALQHLSLDSLRDYPAVYDAIVVQRNRNWVPKIEALLNDDRNYLVIVGALHLLGKDGVVQALEDSGYEVELE